jgi:flagellar hook-associated protein 1 FlgK
VDEVNQTAAAVAEFNKAIVKATRAGRAPNDLQDQRDLLVQKLAGAAGAVLRPGQDGAVDVELSGRLLVSGDTSARLALSGADHLATPADAAAVVWEDDDAATAVGGRLHGMLVELNAVLPAYRDGLQEVTAALVDRVNTQHAQGFDPTGTAGGDVFEVGGGRLRVVITEPGGIAASSTSVAGGDRGGANAAALAELSTAAGGPDQLYRRLVVKLGVDAQAANRRVDIQADILAQVDAAREAESGVNLDEEMASMLAYQRAYEGAARFVSSIDEVLDTLINRTGRVGL